MILLLGSTGYLGQAFARELRCRGISFIPLTRDALDYTRFELLFDYVRQMNPEFLINAAGYSGNPNIDECETNRIETFQANTLLPQMIARVCQATNTPWGHVSSGSIYSGAKVFRNGELRVEQDLNQPEVRELYRARPDFFVGFNEGDTPNATFRRGPCSFYGGTKALAEESLRSTENCFIWRSRMLFDERNEPRNLFTKLLKYFKIYDSIHSMSHAGDFVRACLDLWNRNAPFGIYNLTNPGAVTTRQVVHKMQRILSLDRSFEFWLGDEDFYRFGAKARRSSCILDTSKVQRAGVAMRGVEEAMEEAIGKWQMGEGDTEKIVRGEVFATG